MIPEHLSAGLRPLEPIPTGVEPQIPDRCEVDAVLFDIYGTLFISGSGDISLAESGPREQGDLTTLLQQFNLDLSPAAVRKNLFRAIKASHAESREKGYDFPEVEIDKIWQEILAFNDIRRVREFALAYEILVNPVAPMPHLATLLDSCRSAALVTGIISNAQFFTPLLFDWFLDAVPEKLGFDPDLLFYSWQWGLAKPSPKLFREAAQRLADRGIEARKVIYVGNDMRNDILPAQSTGFQTALFAGDRRSLRRHRDDPQCTGLKPDLVVTDLIQLAKWIRIR